MKKRSSGLDIQQPVAQNAEDRERSKDRAKEDPSDGEKGTLEPKPFATMKAASKEMEEDAAQE